MNVQVFVLLPPLEHAPDQIASRSLVTLSLIDVPLANEADPVLPTATLIPLGLERTLSPLRPVAETVSVTTLAGGVTVNVAVRATPPALAVMVTGVDVLTVAVVTGNMALLAPCATVTLPGTVAAAVLLLASVIAKPPLGAGAVSVTVPCDALPPATVDGFAESADNAGGPGAADCGVKLRTDDHGPLVPAELTARTRHQCWRFCSVPAVNCDVVTV